MRRSKKDRLRIIELNDSFRTTFSGGVVCVERNYYELGRQTLGRALLVLATLNAFTPEGEHNRGKFKVAGYAFEWRIEYRDAARIDEPDAVSPDPGDVGQTLRVLVLSVVNDELLTRSVQA